MEQLDHNAIILRAKTLGALIRDARQANEKSVEECARAIGVTTETFQTFEAGDRAPSLPELEGIAYFLDVPLEHFWESKPLTATPLAKKHANVLKAISLRHRIVGAQIRQARMEAGIQMEALSRWTEIDQARLEAYELGIEPIPIPQLEVLSGFLSRSIREFYDRHGPVGVWVTQQRAIEQFMSMPIELQDFIAKPINRPYLELAVRLSEMSVDRLRAVAEGLLEITY